jgi:hypothetical protein
MSEAERDDAIHQNDERIEECRLAQEELIRTGDYPA